VSANPQRRTAALCAVLITAALILTGLRAAARLGSGAPAPPVDDRAIAALGKRIFFDPSLSASGRISCATCHSPAFAYGPPNGRAVQLGGAHLTAPGTRAVPSLRYTLNRTPIWFHEQAVSLGERLLENEPPAGGFTADGRFDRLRDQASFPLLAASEMANASPAAVAVKLAAAPYAPALRAAFGAGVFADPAGAFAKARYALERFELTDPSFHPFTSKYDAYLDGFATLSPAEAHGKKLFDDPARAGCEICHPDVKGANGAHPVFTDYQFEALGVPRNPEIPANRDPHYHDLGLCGPLRTGMSSIAAFCGLFKTPSLRNVAIRRAFFHNGRFHTLRDALRFYVERDTDPQTWYPAGPNGTIKRYDDIPARYRPNVDTIDPPLKQRRGERPIWNERDIDDVIAFLRTLTDGYSKQSHDAGKE
jgi:cytochrome c peroxidase